MSRGRQEKRDHRSRPKTRAGSQPQPDRRPTAEAQRTADPVDERSSHQAEGHASVDLAQGMEGLAAAGGTVAPTVDAEEPRIARLPQGYRDALEHALEVRALGSGEPGTVEAAVAGAQLDAGESAAAVDQQPMQRDRPGANP